MQYNKPMTTETNSPSKITNDILDVSIKDITKIIATSSAKASAVAILPVPIIDVAGVTFLQVRMVNRLAERYGINSSDKTRLIISALASNLIARMVTLVTEELAATSKLNMLIGESLIKATITGFVTTIIGEIYADHFESGGTLDNISIDRRIGYFKRQFNSDRISVDKVVEVAVSVIDENLNI